MKTGIDYYPEQRSKSAIQRDAELMSKTGIKLVRMGEKSWCKFEPHNNNFCFEWFDEIISVFSRYGIGIVLRIPANLLSGLNRKQKAYASILLKFFSIQAVLQMNLQNIIHRTRQLQEYILNVILIYVTVRTAVQNLYNGLKTDMIILQISTMLSEVLLTELNIPTGNRLRKKRKKVRH